MSHVRATNGEVEAHGHECFAVRLDCPRCGTWNVVRPATPSEYCEECERAFDDEDWARASCACDVAAQDAAIKRKENES